MWSGVQGGNTLGLLRRNGERKKELRVEKPHGGAEALHRKFYCDYGLDAWMKKQGEIGVG